MAKFFTKVLWSVARKVIFLTEYANARLYMKLYVWYLRRRGMALSGVPRYIAPSCWLDGTDYSLIEIGEDVVISSFVNVLTHDYAITRALLAVGVPLESEVANVRPVAIGANSFIGMGSILLPGCRIGRNVIVGAGSVVRGEVPDDVIVAGNPAQEIGSTLEWGRARAGLLASSGLRNGRSRSDRL